MLAFVMIVAALSPQDPAVPVEEALARFKKDFKSPDAAKRASAATGLGKIQHSRTVKILARLLTADEEPVRVSSADALGKWTEYQPQLGAILRAALRPNDKLPKAHAAIIRALGNLRYRAAQRDIDNRVIHSNGLVSVAAIEATGKLGSGSSMDRLIAQLKKIEDVNKPAISSSGSIQSRRISPKVRAMYRMQKPKIFDAFKAITGQDFKNHEAARAWWNKNKRTFRSRK